MHNFTIHNDDNINEKILKDLTVIKNELTRMFPDNIIVLLLTGGFGRGEGGCIVINGDIKIINDYDIHMITKRRVNTEKLKDTAKKLSEILNVDHIDIIAQPKYTIRLLKNTQYGYDLKHGSYLIYGDEGIFNKLPDCSKLSPSEIEKLLFTRAWCFLGPLEKKYFDGLITPDEEFFLTQQLSKALLAIEEAWLIKHNDYDHSYVEKLKRIKKYDVDNKLLRYFEWATEFKVRPSNDVGIDPVKSYFEIKNMFFSEILRLINHSYDKNFTNWIEYSNWYPKRSDVFFNEFLRFVWNKNLSYNKFIKVKLCQILLADAIKYNCIVEKNIDQAKRIFHSINENTHIDSNWWELKDLAIRLQEIINND